MLNLKLDKPSGLFTPAGIAPPIGRGPQDVTLQFLTNNVAEMLPGGADAIALKLYALTDTATPLATFNVWTAVPAFGCYKATLNPLATGLGYVPAGTLYGRLSYGAPNVDTPLFHVLWGAAGEQVGAPITPILVTQPTGPVNYVQDIGDFGGRVATGQTEGFWRVKAPCNLLGLQLNCQDAPTGAALLVEIYKGGAAQGKIGQLTAATKAEETIFGSPLALAIGDIVQFRCTQVGSTKAGTNLAVKGIVQLL